MTSNFEDLNIEIVEDNFISKTHKNAMELLVAEAIEQEIKDYPDELKQQINKVEVAAYALNRLPPLYASSEEGLYRQKKVGQKDYKQQINRLVKQSLAVIQEQPVRFYTPLITTEMQEIEQAKAAMDEIKEYLGFSNQEMSWLDIVKQIKHRINEVAETEIDTQIEN